MIELRNNYENAVNDQNLTEKVIKQLTNDQDKTSVEWGYLGAFEMLEAKHALSPWSKISYFNKGKKHLAFAIEKAPNNIEIRYLRLANQAEAPSFLSYNGQIEEDKKMIIAALPGLTDKDLKTRIVKYLITCDELTPLEVQAVKVQ